MEETSQDLVLVVQPTKRNMTQGPISSNGIKTEFWYCGKCEHLASECLKGKQGNAKDDAEKNMDKD